MRVTIEQTFDGSWAVFDQDELVVEVVGADGIKLAPKVLGVFYFKARALAFAESIKEEKR